MLNKCIRDSVLRDLKVIYEETKFEQNTIAKHSHP